MVQIPSLGSAEGQQSTKLPPEIKLEARHVTDAGGSNDDADESAPVVAATVVVWASPEAMSAATERRVA